MKPLTVAGFTLIELLVAIAILALLVGLSLMAVARLREAAWVTDTRAQLMVIDNAIRDYSAQCGSLPGPTGFWRFASSLPPIPAYDMRTTVTTGQITTMTDSESLVLGLYGGLQIENGAVVYNPTSIGAGPRSLALAGTPHKFPPFLTDTRWLSWQDSSNGRTGHYFDDAGEANDSVIPEILDRFPQGMPLLFMRPARTSYPVTPLSNRTYLNNGVIGPTGQYTLDCFSYTGTFDPSHPWPAMRGLTNDKINPAVAPPTPFMTIGQYKRIPKGKTLMILGSPVINHPIYHGLRTIDLNATMTPGDAGYTYPYDAYHYLEDPNADDTPRRKDSYLLISPGPDRIYGTDDDITNFGD